MLNPALHGVFGIVYPGKQAKATPPNYVQVLLGKAIVDATKSGVTTRIA